MYYDKSPRERSILFVNCVVLIRRYVREWLLDMAMAKVVHMDETGDLFYYPKERLPDFVKATSFASLLPRITGIHEDLMKAFKSTGPLGKKQI